MSFNFKSVNVLAGLLLTFSTSVLAKDPSSIRFTPLTYLEEKMPLVQNIGGYTQTRHYLRTGSLGNVDEGKAITGKPVAKTYEFRNDLRLESDLSYKSRASGKVSVDLQLDYGVDRDDFHPTEQTFRLFEGYGEFDYKNLNARLGRQVIRWGKADEINVIDNFTPQDLTEFLNLSRAERKLPVLAAYLKYFLSSSFTWEGIYIPFFNENRIAGSEEDWEFVFRRNYRKRAGFAALPETRPGRRLENGVWATRLIHQGTLADVSLSYAYHFEQNPSYEIQQNPLFPLGLSPIPGTIKTVWTREHSIGSDFEIAREGWGVRGEAVFVTDKPYVTFNVHDDDLVERKNTIQTVLGFDYTYKSNNYINLQYTQDFIINHHADMEPSMYESSVNWRLERKFMREKLKFEFSGRFFVTDIDFYLKWQMYYELRPNLDLYFGYMLFEGDEIGLFGQFDNCDQLFLKLKQYF